MASADPAFVTHGGSGAVRGPGLWLAWRRPGAARPSAAVRAAAGGAWAWPSSRRHGVEAHGPRFFFVSFDL